MRRRFPVVGTKVLHNKSLDIVWILANEAMLTHGEPPGRSLTLASEWAGLMLGACTPLTTQDKVNTRSR